VLVYTGSLGRTSDLPFHAPDFQRKAMMTPRVHSSAAISEHDAQQAHPQSDAKEVCARHAHPPHDGHAYEHGEPDVAGSLERGDEDRIEAARGLIENRDEEDRCYERRGPRIRLEDRDERAFQQVEGAGEDEGDGGSRGVIAENLALGLLMTGRSRRGSPSGSRRPLPIEIPEMKMKRMRRDVVDEGGHRIGTYPFSR